MLCVYSVRGWRRCVDFILLFLGLVILMVLFLVRCALCSFTLSSISPLLFVMILVLYGLGVWCVVGGGTEGGGEFGVCAELSPLPRQFHIHKYICIHMIAFT